MNEPSPRRSGNANRKARGDKSAGNRSRSVAESMFNVIALGAAKM
jgi:hypothetical protein